MNHYICIHGHFYQPPRENPWLESIDHQPSAYPYHDWNERITAECYEPNAESRILDDRGYIRSIVSNYARMSFNIGPTLLSWMRGHAPDVYKRIIWSDCQSRERFGGHGNALAQSYNHMIMPLASARDKRTQVIWGIRDFEFTYGRYPEGMWLPETAVDIASMEAMAEHGIRFTLLAPRQAARVRQIPTGPWKDVRGGMMDSAVPYLCKLPSGRSIVIFFYDGPISQAVAFEGILADGANFAKRLESGFSLHRKGPQLVHIATDGESYGHHHRFGDMALASALDIIEQGKTSEITNYAHFLDLCPPIMEVEIVEESSWSCFHGIERWRNDCGCGGNVPTGWSREWRGALRIALDGLRDDVAPRYEERAAQYLKDPWAARNSYINVALTHEPLDFQRWLAENRTRDLTNAEEVIVRQLMEMQRQAMLMFTSCGWFFDELSGLEATQILRYAARCIQLGENLLGVRLEKDFLKRLSLGNSNMPEYRDGADVYNKLVRPAVVDLLKVGAHYAVMSLFRNTAEEARIYAFNVLREDQIFLKNSEGDRFLVGHGSICSRVTDESLRFAYGVLFRGDQNLLGGVRELSGHEDQAGFASDIKQAFEETRLDDAAKKLRQYFSGNTFSLATLFRDEQSQIVAIILKESISEIMNGYRQMYERFSPLVTSLAELSFPVPEVLHKTMEFVFNANLRLVFETENFDVEEARRLFEEAKSYKLQLDALGLTYQLTSRLNNLADKVEADHSNVELISRLGEMAGFARELPLVVNFNHPQNIVYAIKQCYWESMQTASVEGNNQAALWMTEFQRTSDKLKVAVAKVKV